MLIIQVQYAEDIDGVTLKSTDEGWISGVQAELKLMEVRIGVASHTLLQTCLKNKENALPSRKSKPAMADYDSEEGF